MEVVGTDEFTEWYGALSDADESAVYRVVYPPHARPTFTTRGVACLVIDCSELGIRFEWTGGDVSEACAQVRSPKTWSTTQAKQVSSTPAYWSAPARPPSTQPVNACTARRRKNEK